ncbi:DinB family protein [Streptomyces sp. NPDC000594]|uniref:DinB family protein n=1 Tax=Streptomyces sp. NPDC000594 TaxID=3154261 RepID=UPI003316EE1D
MTTDSAPSADSPDPTPTGSEPVRDRERSTLLRYLRDQRLTLERTCSGLDAEQLARRSVPPSTLSLLGLIRHLTRVEHYWFRQLMEGRELPMLYRTEDDRDGDFNGAVADPEVVERAWAAWREEVAHAERFLATAHDLLVTGDHRGQPITLRDVLVHMIEEYARHNGHADLLRERIDGRVGR